MKLPPKKKATKPGSTVLLSVLVPRVLIDRLDIQAQLEDSDRSKLVRKILSKRLQRSS